MAKKKAKQQSQTISPEKYIKTKARSLPIGECLIRKGWQELGMGEIIVTRKHTSGNVTFALYLVDAFCLGLKDSLYKFNSFPDEYEEVREDLFRECGYDQISYEEAHNIIYGAIAYAEELGFEPGKTFAISKYILEEDTEEIPLLEYEFGKDGIPCLIATTRLEASRYIPVLNKNVGEGNYKLLILNEDDEEEYDEYEYVDDEEEYDDDDLEGFFDNINPPILTYTEYAYNYPEYPQELALTHAELNVLFLPENKYSLPKETTDIILALPAESLIEDLKHIILYTIGEVVRFTEDEYLEKSEDHSAIMHALFILGELRAEQCLDVVLEVMRQNDFFMDVQLGDSGNQILPLTLYYTGRNRLPDLFEYVKEPGLYPYLRYFVFTAVTIVCRQEPERREEVIDWFRNVLLFYTDNFKDSTVFDSNLAGMLLFELIEINAKELLPEIKQLFDTGEVDKMSSGDYKDVEDDLLSNTPPLHNYPLLSIYERYEEYEKTWKK